jgi:hypothetical protein
MKKDRHLLAILEVRQDSSARAAGYSLSDAIAAGYSETDIKEWDSIPVLEKPYHGLYWR